MFLFKKKKSKKKKRKVFVIDTPGVIGNKINYKTFKPFINY